MKLIQYRSQTCQNYQLKTVKTSNARNATFKLICLFLLYTVYAWPCNEERLQGFCKEHVDLAVGAIRVMYYDRQWQVIGEGDRVCSQGSLRGSGYV